VEAGWFKSGYGSGLCDELPIDPIQRTSRSRIRDRGAHDLATLRVLRSGALHEPFDRAAGHRHVFPVQLMPDLDCAVACQARKPIGQLAGVNADFRLRRLVAMNHFQTAVVIETSQENLATFLEMNLPELSCIFAVGTGP
jgi:hypothetical protein